jgi:hypothetical protein
LGTKAFSDDQLANSLPTFSSGSTVEEGVPRNSYMAYMQMQQQQ